MPARSSSATSSAGSARCSGTPVRPSSGDSTSRPRRMRSPRNDGAPRVPRRVAEPSVRNPSREAAPGDTVPASRAS
ncbi:hypothetical protein M885DRAFT_625118 [Pelagophyceae sp. CCMP2097]|nr:hypothetical protein M885DRAFT_625118 [Pelagophyceae sp. CCMP2097]